MTSNCIIFIAKLQIFSGMMSPHCRNNGWVSKIGKVSDPKSTERCEKSWRRPDQQIESDVVRHCIRRRPRSRAEVRWKSIKTELEKVIDHNAFKERWPARDAWVERGMSCMVLWRQTWSESTWFKPISYRFWDFKRAAGSKSTAPYSKFSHLSLFQHWQIGYFWRLY